PGRKFLRAKDGIHDNFQREWIEQCKRCGQQAERGQGGNVWPKRFCLPQQPSVQGKVGFSARLVHFVVSKPPLKTRWIADMAQADSKSMRPNKASVSSARISYAIQY